MIICKNLIIYVRKTAKKKKKKSLLQHHSSKASILWCSAFFIVQLSHPHMTTGKTIALSRWTIIDKVMSTLFNMLSRLVITFLPRSAATAAKSLQSCPTLCDPIDGSPPGSPVPGHSGKEPACQCRRHKRLKFDPWDGKIP